MSTNPSNGKNTAQSTSNSITDTIGEWLAKNGLFTLATVTAIGLYIGSFVESSKYIGGKDDWNTIRPRITTIIGLSIGGALALGLAALMYFMANQEKAIYFQIIVTSLAMGMAYAALAVASISRQA